MIACLWSFWSTVMLWNITPRFTKSIEQQEICWIVSEENCWLNSSRSNLVRSGHPRRTLPWNLIRPSRSWCNVNHNKNSIHHSFSPLLHLSLFLSCWWSIGRYGSSDGWLLLCVVHSTNIVFCWTLNFVTQTMPQEQITKHVDFKYCTKRNPLIYEYTPSRKSALRLEEAVRLCEVVRHCVKG